MILDDLDRALIHATQKGLPLSATPFLDLANALKTSESEVLKRFEKMLQNGIIRRIAAVPNHYALGIVANGMAVWDIADSQVESVGQFFAQNPEVSHCYERPRHLPQWRFNLFTMLHGENRESVVNLQKTLIADVNRLFPQALQAHDILFSSRILKKTGARFLLEPRHVAH